MKFTLFHKFLTSGMLLLFIILLSGCPFSSSVPIDEGSVKVLDKLEGNWVSASDTESENPTFFEITKKDKFHADARKKEFSASDSIYTETLYHLTFSDVNGDVFMNAMEDGGSAYNLYKFSFDEKKMEITTSEVTDYIKETFSSSKELKDFIAKNKDKSFFFTNTIETYIRK